ncbi:MAG TPA: hypothetical protein VMW22_05015, partial [Candidatus Desulfaltia sp.]|nr:hypothetical protein [Candidatus Desulfaltia sp.]
MDSRPLEGCRYFLYTLLILFMIICSCLGVKPVSATDHTYVVFEDGFEEGAGDAWNLWSPQDAPEGSGWAVLYDGGNNVLSLKGNVFAEAGDREWANYTIEVRVKFVEGPVGAHVSVRVGEPAP